MFIKFFAIFCIQHSWTFISCIDIDDDFQDLGIFMSGQFDEFAEFSKIPSMSALDWNLEWGSGLYPGSMLEWSSFSGSLHSTSGFDFSSLDLSFSSSISFSFDDEFSSFDSSAHHSSTGTLNVPVSSSSIGTTDTTGTTGGASTTSNTGGAGNTSSTSDTNNTGNLNLFSSSTVAMINATNTSNTTLFFCKSDSIDVLYLCQHNKACLDGNCDCGFKYKGSLCESPNTYLQMMQMLKIVLTVSEAEAFKLEYAFDLASSIGISSNHIMFQYVGTPLTSSSLRTFKHENSNDFKVENTDENTEIDFAIVARAGDSFSILSKFNLLMSVLRDKNSTFYRNSRYGSLLLSFGQLCSDGSMADQVDDINQDPCSNSVDTLSSTSIPKEVLNVSSSGANLNPPFIDNASNSKNQLIIIIISLIIFFVVVGAIVIAIVKKRNHEKQIHDSFIQN